MIAKINTTLNGLLKNQSASGIVIFLAVLVAMIWANSSWKEMYEEVIHTEISIGIAGFFLSESFLLWINDGLMAIFFLQVGLELKREIIGGKLSSVRKAILPIGAAIGGMMVPAIIYLAFNANNSAMRGWGIPMATDIAFAIGVLSLFGDRVPASLKVFLLALAIVDDLGAVLVIAIFYTSGISYIDLLYGVLFFFILLGGNLLGIRKAWFYALVGIGGVWLAFFFSGVHPTIAGVLTAFAVPGRVKIKEEGYLKNLQKLHIAFLETKPIRGNFISEKQLNILEEIKQKSDDAETPLQKIEHHLAPVVGFFILPLFALTNTGIHIHGDLLETMSHPISLGVVFGLLVGKFIGIMGASWILVKLKIAELQEGIFWKNLSGVALIAGIGFTMSLFITELAFESEEFTFIAKLSILFTSVLAGISGAIVLQFSGSKTDKYALSNRKVQQTRSW
uniref:Na(+)/H(+) antiporter NhaA n=1 Tax=Roseihalotalea indica TaxID=2867963 RepID=A0AA49GRL6_9BACT|nr:Na+/H+ antiporter NhaA [Tunicatimonas sp. TK19036]WKN38629.1 Na+/H+ antiporter NhaA [Tunicatimonas sp. TK19036]